MERIAIIGTTGTGKTTLARRIAAIGGHRVVDLDELHWLPGWRARPPAEFAALVEAATREPRWVVAGNYTILRDIVWSRADTLVWLDLPALPSFARLARRSLQRVLSREPICNGNVESLRQIVSRESILLWFLRTYAANHRRYGEIFAAPGKWAGLTMIRLRSTREIDALVARVTE